MIAFAASAALIGCGGGGGVGGGTSGSGGGGGGGGGRGLPTPNLGSTAQAQILFLSGQGRRGIVSQIAVLENIRLFNSVTDFAPREQNIGSPIRVKLDAYTLNQFVFDVPLVAGGPSKLFSKYPFEVAKIDQEEDGVVSTVFGGPPVLINPFFDLDFKLFPGRQTTLQVVLNDATLGFNGTDGVVFDRDQFERENYAPFNNKMNAFLSDMFMFDVSQLPANQRPPVSSGGKASMVLFSGDSIGVASAFKNDKNGVPAATFDYLSPVAIDSGIMRQPQIVGGRQAPGIYTVLEPNPTDPFGNSKILALKGTYRAYTEVLSNLSDFAMVAIPTTRSLKTNQVVVVNRNSSGVITAMWQGVVDYTTNATGDIRLYSLDQLPDASATPRATGKISMTRQNGQVKQGTFTITSSPADFPFPKTGGFVVLR